MQFGSAPRHSFPLKWDTVLRILDDCKVSSVLLGSHWCFSCFQQLVGKTTFWASNLNPGSLLMISQRELFRCFAMYIRLLLQSGGQKCSRETDESGETYSCWVTRNPNLFGELFVSSSSSILIGDYKEIFKCSLRNAVRVNFNIFGVMSLWGAPLEAACT